MAKIEFVNSLDEADRLLRAYCEQIDFDPQWITDAEWETAKRIACDRKVGLRAAEATLDTDKAGIQQATARAARQASLQVPLQNLLTAIGTDHRFKTAVEGSLLQACAGRYVSGESCNLGYGKVYTASEYTDQGTRWTQLAQIAANPFIGTFQALPPQNKAALGKGNVGSTLDTRTWQGNLLVTIGGKQFNLHLDLKM